MLTWRRDAGDSRRHFIRGKAGGRGINCMEEDSPESSQLNGRDRREGGRHAERPREAPEPETPGPKNQTPRGPGSRDSNREPTKDARGNSKPGNMDMTPAP